MATSKKKKKRVKRKKKNKIVAIAISIIIVIIVAIGIYFTPSQPSEMDFLVIPSSYGIDVVVHLKSSTAGHISASGKIRITYEEKTLYEKNVNTNNGMVKINLSYSEFAWANGNYTIHADFNGIHGTKVIPLYDFVENVNATAYNITHKTAPDYLPVDKARIGVNMIFMSKDGVAKKTGKNDKVKIIINHEGNFLEEHIEKVSEVPMASFNYSVKKGGNYSVKVIYYNNRMMNSSPYSKIEKICTDPLNTTEVIFLNFPPKADAGGDKTAKYKITEGGAVVSFDGSASMDFDGKIVKYQWDFGDGTYDTGVKVTHKYTSTGEFTVVLTVIDNGGEWDTDTIIVRVTY